MSESLSQRLGPVPVPVPGQGQGTGAGRGGGPRRGGRGGGGGGGGGGGRGRRGHHHPYHTARGGKRGGGPNNPKQPNKPAQSQSESSAASPAISSAELASESHLDSQRFADLAGQIDHRLLSAVPFQHMTQVQAATLPDALAGRDVLAQAKTGTGKTVAFLVPSIQRLCMLPSLPPDSSISVLVLSPTRELALQIEKEAKMLTNNLPFDVQHVVGGTNIAAERKRLNSQRKDILIATPGRLLDHLQDEQLNLANTLRGLTVLVLDEADRMLDMGFRRELEKIFAHLPPAQTRQSLFFSATIPDFVHNVAKLKDDHAFISTISEEDNNTHEHVPQQFALVPMADTLPLALSVLSEASGKQIVFCPTARATALAADIFRALGHPNVFDIHSRKSQSMRTKTMSEFRSAQSGVLFSSDVTARGVDVPGITLVLQLNLPMSEEQYVHRLGRTARAGQAGTGMLVLAKHEEWFLKKLSDLPLQQINPPSLDKERQLVNDAMKRVDEDSRSKAYQAALGYYKSYLKPMGWNATTLVSEMNAYARHVLCWPHKTPPPILNKTVGKMGLKGVPGLYTVKELPGKDRD